MIETILLICLIAVSAADTCIILAQEGNENSLGSITGTVDNGNSYMRQNNKRTAKYRLKAATVVLSILALALVIGLLIFA